MKYRDKTWPITIVEWVKQWTVYNRGGRKKEGCFVSRMLSVSLPFCVCHIVIAAKLDQEVEGRSLTRASDQQKSRKLQKYSGDGIDLF